MTLKRIPARVGDMAVSPRGHHTDAQARAARIAAEDAARDRAGRIAHSQLGALRSSITKRTAQMPPLTDFK